MPVLENRARGRTTQGGDATRPAQSRVQAKLPDELIGTIIRARRASAQLQRPRHAELGEVTSAVTGERIQLALQATASVLRRLLKYIVAVSWACAAVVLATALMTGALHRMKPR